MDSSYACTIVDTVDFAQSLAELLVHLGHLLTNVAEFVPRRPEPPLHTGNSISWMVGAWGLEPQTSTVSR